MAKAKSAAAAKSLRWHTPGDASATLFFTDAAAQTGINVSLMPGYEFEHAVQALIGDAITNDDIIDLNGFEQVLARAAEDRRFVRVSLVNRSQSKRKFQLAFLFGGDAGTDKRFEYELEANGRIRDRINVTIVS